MLESLIGGKRGQTTWDGIIPQADSNTLFRLANFNTVDDIKDSSGNAIALTNYGVTVGSDTHGTYLYFNGSSGWLELKSTLLDKANVEITFIIGDIVPNGGPYGQALMDCRPFQTNGNYFTFGVQTQTSNLALVTNYPSSLWTIAEKGPEANPLVLKFILKDRQVAMWSGGVLLATHLITDNNAPGTFVNQFVKLGISAYYNVGVPYLNAKMYYCEIKNLP